MYLADTNIFIEGLLEQERAHTVKSFFQKIDLHDIFVTDLSLHSIGIVLYRVGKFELFVKFLKDLIIDGMEILSLEPEELKKMHHLAQSFHPDFDDACQYAVAEKINCN